MICRSISTKQSHHWWILIFSLALAIVLFQFFPVSTTHATPPGVTLATLNMQGTTDQSGNKWSSVVKQLTTSYTIVALQKVGYAPPNCQIQDDQIINGYEVVTCYWNAGTNDRPIDRMVYWLSNPGANNTTRNIYKNIAFVTPVGLVDNLTVIRPATNNAWRAGLGIHIANDWYFSFHAISGGGSDAVNFIQDAATAAGGDHWAVLGDFNTDPATLRNRFPNPGNYYFVTSGQSTQRCGSELDYMVASTPLPPGYGAQVVGNMTSDHFPVSFAPLVWSNLRLPSCMFHIKLIGKSWV